MTTRIKSASIKGKYSTSLSCQRLRNVQALLKLDNGKQEHCDAILAVLGVDSKFNEGCREFVNYLTLGFFSLSQKELEKAGLEEEDMEEVLVLVQQNSVSLYCGSALYSFLLPYVAHWRNLQIYCKSPAKDDQDQEADAEESYKIRSFIDMVKNCKVIGVPYLGSSFVQNAGKKSGSKSEFSIENWPLIQAYASSDFGCGEAFTSHHVAVNVRDSVLPLYNQCSPFALEKIIETSYPLFKRHWNEALSVINSAAKSKNILQLKEDQVSEPLKSYFKHGQLSRIGKKQSPVVTDATRKPCALFGKHTTDIGKEVEPITFKAGARKGKQSPAHMILQCVSPNGPLLCTRTYFFRPEEKSSSIDKEFDGLVHLYTVCTQGCTQAINEFSSTLSISKGERKGEEHLLSKGISCGLVFDVKCSITACDKVGKKVQIKDGKFAPYVYVIKVGAENVRTSHGGDVIGSVLFAETFVISSLKVEGGSGSGNDAVCNVLTSDVPVYMEWRFGSVETIKEYAEEEPMADCKNLIVCSASDIYSPPSFANIQFNQDGSMLLSAQNMDDMLLKSGVQYSDGLNPGEVCLIIISFDLPENAKYWDRVPPNFRGDVSIIPDIAVSQPSKCMVLALIPSTQAYKEFYAVVVHHVQNDTESTVTIKRAKALSDDIRCMYDSIQYSHKNGIPISKSTFLKPGSAVKCLSPSSFMAHLTLATISDSLPVPGNVLDAILRKKSVQVKDPMADSEIVPVTIISGHPSSGADEIGMHLVNLNKEKVRWVVLRPTLTHGSVLNKTAIEEQLAQAVQNKRVTRPSAAARKKLRIIIIAVGFYDLCEIIQCVVSHPGVNVREQLRVGAVTFCVSPKALHMLENQNYPKYFDQCLPGIVSNFAFVVEDQEISGTLDKSLNEAQSLIRNVNKQAAFMICPGGKLMRKNDFDMVLAEDNFTSLKMLTDRFLLRPELNAGRYQPVPSVPLMSKVRIEFSQPLLKGSFSARLRGLKSSVSRPQLFGSVCFVSGCVAFTDSPKQEHDVSFSSATKDVMITLRDTVTSQPAPPSKVSLRKAKSYFLEFYGIGMNEEELKNWLRKCGRQKPSKKCHKTKNRLTKGEIRRIHEENSTRNLPDGYFYNGSFYVSLFDNKKMMHHPYMAQFIDEYLAAENEEIDAYNAEIEKQNIKDLFD